MYKSTKRMLLFSSYLLNFKSCVSVKKNMKFFIFSLIFIIAVKAQKNYPEYDDQMCVGYEDGVLFGIDNECRNYYYCVDQVAYLDDCQNLCDGCQFDVNINDCNYAENAQCVEIEEPITNAPTTQPPTTTTTQSVTTTTQATRTTDIVEINCPPDQIVFLESENCTEYYICAFGQKLTLRCMEGLVWNNQEKQCDHPVYNPRCSGVSVDQTNRVTCNRYGFYTTAYPFDCEKFVYCSEGVPIVR